MNRKWFQMMDADSGSLTPFDAYYHNFSESGHYHININKQGVPWIEHEILVHDAPDIPKQLSIDIEEYSNNLKKRKLDHCLQVRTGGFVTWYPSHSVFDLSIHGHGLDSKNLIFNSIHLQYGDIYLRKFLPPGSYVVKNSINARDFKMQVKIDPIKGKNEFGRTRESIISPIKIICSENGFNQDSVVAVVGQPLIWIVDGKKSYRISIRLKK